MFYTGASVSLAHLNLLHPDPSFWCIRQAHNPITATIASRHICLVYKPTQEYGIITVLQHLPRAWCTPNHSSDCISETAALQDDVLVVADAETRLSQALSSLAGGKCRLDDIPACEDSQQPAGIVHHRKPADLQRGKPVSAELGRCTLLVFG